MANRGTGAGGAKTNANGKTFEGVVFRKIISKIPAAKLIRHDDLCSPTQDFFEITKCKKIIGLIGTQDTMFKYFKNNDLGGKKVTPIIQSVWTKMLKPDIFILDFNAKEIHIFELKYQKGGGSVAEKIQSGHYKLLMWEKLFNSFGFAVSYEYILSTKKFWEKIQKQAPFSGKKAFGSAFDYLKSNGVKYTIIKKDASDYAFKIKDYIK